MKLQDYVQNKTVLKTEQLILRPLRKEDVADLKEWLGDSSVYRYWGKRPGKSDLNPNLLFQRPKKPTKSFHWGVVHKQDHKVIGDMWVYLIENDRMAKVAFRLSPAYQGNRLMTEALARAVIFCFEETELQRLWADVHTQNIASYKTLEKVGFKHLPMLNTFDRPAVSMNYVLVDEGVPLVAGNIVLEIRRKTLEKPEIYLGLETEVRISEQMPVGENTGVDVPGQLQDGFVKRELPAGEYIICRVEAEKYYRDFEGMACMEIWVKPLPMKNKG